MRMNYIQVELEKSLLDPALGSTLTGFRFFWGMVVSGFDHRYHCLRCLVGRRVKELTPEWQTGPEGRVSVLIPDGAYLYLCGVARQRRLSLNFHMVLKPGDETISLPTHNAYVVRAYNAQRVPIPSERAARVPHLSQLSIRRGLPRRLPHFERRHGIQHIVHDLERSTGGVDRERELEAHSPLVIRPGQFLVLLDGVHNPIK
jgi:hypothetical protein